MKTRDMKILNCLMKSAGEDTWKKDSGDTLISVAVEYSNYSIKEGEFATFLMMYPEIMTLLTREILAR